MREERRKYIRQKEVEDKRKRGTRGYGGQEEVKDKRKWQSR